MYEPGLVDLLVEESDAGIRKRWGSAAVGEEVQPNDFFEVEGLPIRLIRRLELASVHPVLQIHEGSGLVRRKSYSATLSLAKSAVERRTKVIRMEGKDSFVDLESLLRKLGSDDDPHHGVVLVPAPCQQNLGVLNRATYAVAITFGFVRMSEERIHAEPMLLLRSVGVRSPLLL